MKSKIDDEIDVMPMHEMTGEEAASKIDPNSLNARLERRQIRYYLYCLRSKEEGKTIPDDLPAELIGKFMLQDGFDGFQNFAITWDVALNDSYKIVSRRHSEAEEWERVVQAKFPQIQPDGSVKYPDMSVKKAVDKEAKNQAAIKKTRAKSKTKKK